MTLKAKGSASLVAPMAGHTIDLDEMGGMRVDVLIREPRSDFFGECLIVAVATNAALRCGIEALMSGYGRRRLIAMTGATCQLQILDVKCREIRSCQSQGRVGQQNRAGECEEARAHSQKLEVHDLTHDQSI